MKNRGWLALISVFAANPGFAAPFLDQINDLTNTSNAAVRSIISTGVIGATHRSYSTAKSNGWRGFDIGLAIDGVPLPDDFMTAVELASGSEVPIDVLPIPRLVLSKSFPFGFEVGASLLTIGTSDFLIAGGDIKWTIQGLDSIKFLPKFAVRASVARTRLVLLEGTTVGFDAIASFSSIPVLEPFLGLGMQYADGKLLIPDGTTIPPGLSTSHNFAAAHFFVGLAINLAFFHIVPMYDYSTIGVHSIGTKISFGL